MYEKPRVKASIIYSLNKRTLSINIITGAIIKQTEYNLKSKHFNLDLLI